jgi:hypothetical protein
MEDKGAKLVHAEKMAHYMAEVAFEKGEHLKIMGIQDDYRAWSRMNCQDGKFFLLPGDRSGSSKNSLHVFFDDYSFSETSNRTQKVEVNEQRLKRVRSVQFQKENKFRRVQKGHEEDAKRTGRNAKAAGPYILAMWNARANRMVGEASLDKLKKLYSGEGKFQGKDGNTPLVYTVVMNKAGSASNTAAGDPLYFIKRVKGTLSALHRKYDA